MPSSGTRHLPTETIPTRTVALAVVGVWLALAVLSATENFVLFAIQREEVHPWSALAQSVVSWSPWAAFTPLILWIGHRFSVRGPRWPLIALAHLGIALVLGIPYAVVAAWSWLLFGTVFFTADPTFVRLFIICYLSGLPLMVLAYAGVHGLGRASYWFSRSRAAELGAARLEKELAESRLAALQMQVHPHFLFNALNAVDTLVRDGDKEGAGRVIYLLSDLLRETLEERKSPTIRLGHELAFLEKYLEIQGTRFPDRLKVSVDVEESLQGVAVPAFVLQPLVENALRHGIAPNRNAGRLSIRAAASGDRLVLTVDDDGRGPPAADTPGGLGIRNLRSRLEVMYGSLASVELKRNEWGGAAAVVTLPFPAAPAE